MIAFLVEIWRDLKARKILDILNLTQIVRDVKDCPFFFLFKERKEPHKKVYLEKAPLEVII